MRRASSLLGRTSFKGQDQSDLAISRHGINQESAIRRGLSKSRIRNRMECRDHRVYQSNLPIECGILNPCTFEVMTTFG
jgi:hypothetical protein